MKPLSLTLSAAALLLSLTPARALSVAPLLLTGGPFGVMLTLPENALPPVLETPAVSPLRFAPPWSLNGSPFWSRTQDPSLRLGDWRHVFDIAALGHFDIPLRDDPDERTNILLAAQAVDAVTVAPGAEFSFNEQVGERTPERGYRAGLMFDNGRVIRGTGGRHLPGGDGALQRRAPCRSGD